MCGTLPYRCVALRQFLFGSHDGTDVVPTGLAGEALDHPHLLHLMCVTPTIISTAVAVSHACYECADGTKQMEYVADETTSVME